jgi:hypothetical protein
MSEPWFRRNERGIGGPGMPIHRNGWILLGGFVAYLITFPLLLQVLLGYPPGTPERFFAIIGVTVPVFLIAWRKTAPEKRHLSED